MVIRFPPVQPNRRNAILAILQAQAQRPGGFIQPPRGLFPQPRATIQRPPIQTLFPRHPGAVPGVVQGPPAVHPAAAALLASMYPNMPSHTGSHVLEPADFPIRDHWPAEPMTGLGTPPASVGQIPVPQADSYSSIGNAYAEEALKRFQQWLLSGAGASTPAGRSFGIA